MASSVPAPSPLSTLRRSILSLASPNALLPVACLLGGAIVVSIWLLYADRVEQERTVALHAARKSSENIVLIVATNLEEVLGRAALYARIAEDAGKPGRAGAAFLNPQQVGDSAYVRAAVFDAGGVLVYSSANQRREPELEPLLAQSLGRPEAAQAILVGHPAAGDKGQWRLPVLVPLAGSDGPRAYYGAIVDLGYFLRSYRSVDLGPGGTPPARATRNCRRASVRPSRTASSACTSSPSSRWTRCRWRAWKC
jgi:diguanylate cyclase